MLTLRPGTVVEAGADDAAEQRVVVDVDGVRRPAIVDVGLVGACSVGDDVVVNTAAADLGLGSGGFDIVHVNLTRGLGGAGAEGAHVMKLNYTSLQHAVVPVEGEELRIPLDRPAGVFGLHGQLAPIAWAFARARPGGQLGYVQTAGGALSGGHSRVVRDLRERGLLAGHITAGPAFGGEEEAITTAGAIHHAIADRGWDAVVCGPGPGILGSASALGHGGMSALDSAHAAAALGCPVVLCARMSDSDERRRHRGLSHHTVTVLALLLARVTVAVPAGEETHLGGLSPESHVVRELPVQYGAYVASGLPARSMGRDDQLFFRAALACGAALADTLPL
jgi:Protein of unknown function (DUF3866)